MEEVALSEQVSFSFYAYLCTCSQQPLSYQASIMSTLGCLRVLINLALQQVAVVALDGSSIMKLPLLRHALMACFC